MLKKVAVLAAAAAAIGCTAKEAPKVDSAATAAAAPATPNVVTITAKDFAFEAPDSIKSGMTTLILKNTGTTLHHAQLFRLKDGKTLADLQAGMKNMKPTDPLPPWIEEAGGVNVPEPGAETSATLMIQPGNYVVLCFVDTPDHVPHVMKGMIKGLTVTPSTGASAPAPTPDVTVTLSDYTFAFSTPLTAGHHTVKIENSGTQHHELALFQLLPGKTIDDLTKWGASYKGPEPFKAMGGVPGMAPGMSQFVNLDLTAGDYVVICFLPDAKDGKPHMQHGMVMPIKVQ